MNPDFVLKRKQKSKKKNRDTVRGCNFRLEALLFLPPLKPVMGVCARVRGVPLEVQSDRRGGWETDLSHEDLRSLDEDGGAGHVEALLQALQTQLLHLLIAALHLHWVERQHGDLLHVLQK